MIKKSMLFFVFLGLALSIQAQKVDLDRAWFTYKYRDLPNRVLDPSFTTYSVSVTKSAALSVFSNEVAINQINIEGKKKLESGAHLGINIRLDDLMIEKSEVKERIEIKKDKDGKETGRSYFYRVEVEYNFAAEANVKDYTGNSISSYSLSSRSEKKQYTTKEFSKSADAANYYNNNKVEIKSQLVDEQINKALAQLNGALKGDIAYASNSSRDNFWDLGSKKHPEFTAYTEATAIAVAALQSMTVNEIPQDIKEKLKPAIEYFLTLPEKYSTDDKAEKKLRYGAYFNLATIFLHTEQFDLAKEYAKKLIANDYDVKDGEKLMEFTHKIETDLKKHNLESRHFVIDVTDAQGPQ